MSTKTFISIVIIFSALILLEGCATVSEQKKVDAKVAASEPIGSLSQLRSKEDFAITNSNSLSDKQKNNLLN